MGDWGNAEEALWRQGACRERQAQLPSGLRECSGETLASAYRSASLVPELVQIFGFKQLLEIAFGAGAAVAVG